MIRFSLPQRSLIGMVHVDALPGSPRSQRTIAEIAARAVAEAKILATAGFDAVMLENMHDRPYVNTHGPEAVAAMTRIAVAVREELPTMPLGIQILSSGEREALAVCLAVGGQFIRCENFVFAHVADEGLMAEAKAGPLLRYRRSIGAEHVAIFCDIKKKHASHALTADITLEDAAHAADFFGADAVVITGKATGEPTDPLDVSTVNMATGLKLPVLVGSGATTKDIPALFKAGAAGIIVGSSIKEGGHWAGPVDAGRCAQIVASRGR